MNEVLELEKCRRAVKRSESQTIPSESLTQSLSAALERIGEEYCQEGKILGFGRQELPRLGGITGADCYGRPCALPIGPGASPLTIPYIGILSAYLAGARFFELPVQAALAFRMATLKGSRGAVKTGDEARVSEIVLKEFLLGRVLNLVLGSALGLNLESAPPEPCVYTANISAETDPETADFLQALQDGRAQAIQNALLEELKTFSPTNDPFRGSDLEGRLLKLGNLGSKLQAPLISALCLAIPDGLPLKEAEGYISRLIEEARVPIELKLGPWILGNERLADIFRRQGEERDSSIFGRNASVRYSEAIMIIRRLFTRAREAGLFFGVKVDGSMPSAIGRSLMRPEPDHRKPSPLLSGPPVYAAGLCLAARVAEDLSGSLPISFAGGLDALRAKALFQTGVRPLTLTSVLYSPAGFRALSPIAEAMSSHHGLRPSLGIGLGRRGINSQEKIDVRALRDLVSSVLP